MLPVENLLTPSLERFHLFAESTSWLFHEIQNMLMSLPIQRQLLQIVHLHCLASHCSR